MRIGVAPFTPRLRDGSLKLMGEGRGTHLLHQSEVLDHIERSLYGERVYGDNDLYAQTGFMWERMVGKVLAEYCSVEIGDLIEVGELSVDDILLTPDRFDAVNGIVYEFKGWWWSMKHCVLPDGTANVAGILDKHWRAVAQTMNYCRALGTTLARLVPLWMNGDYSRKPPMGGPQTRVIEFEFTEDELDAHWQMMLVNAEDLRRVRGTK